MLFLVLNDVTYDKFICLNLCYPRKSDVFLSERMLHTKMCNVRTHVTHEYEILSKLILHYIRKCVMSEPMLYMKIWCLESELMWHIKCVMSEHTLNTNIRLLLYELMFHTKMCNVRTYITNEYEILSVRTYVTLGPNIHRTSNYGTGIDLLEICCLGWVFIILYDEV